MDNHLGRLRGEARPARYPFRLVGKDGGTRWVQNGACLIEWQGRADALNLLTRGPTSESRAWMMPHPLASELRSRPAEPRPRADETTRPPSTPICQKNPRGWTSATASPVG